MRWRTRSRSSGLSSTKTKASSRGDAQIDAAPRRFAPQEVALHLKIAIAEQEHVEARASAAEIAQSRRGGDAPIGVRALLALAAMAIEEVARIAAMHLAQGEGGVRQLLLRRAVGQDAALHEVGDRGAERRFVVAEPGAKITDCRIERARLVEISDELGKLAIDRHPHVRHGMKHQHAIVGERQQVGEARAAHDHDGCDLEMRNGPRQHGGSHGGRIPLPGKSRR